MNEDDDAKWDAWFEQQRRNGYAVLSRDEWKAKLDEAESIGYAEGRLDQLTEAAPLYDELTEALRNLLPILARMYGQQAETMPPIVAARATLSRATGSPT